MNTIKITVQVIVYAEKSKVWDYYTNPNHIVNWNFADPSWHCPSAENDMRIGGTYKARMEAKNGSFGFDFEAIYETVTEKQELTYKMSDGRKATTIFESDGGDTSVITTFDAETENPIEMQQEGWQAILNNFKHYAEQIG